MARFLLFLLRALTGPAMAAPATAGPATTWPPGAGPRPAGDSVAPAGGQVPPVLSPGAPAGYPAGYLIPADPGAGGPGAGGPAGGRGRRRLPRWVKWATVLALIGLIFRRAVASVVLMALSAAFHLVGISVHLPSIRFGWPWQSVSAGTTSNIDLGPWVLQKVEGISRPAFGQANFSFLFTHKVSRNIGIWPCWYASTFYAVAHASATVNLNPGRAWWQADTGHYRLQVISRPAAGLPGRVGVAMVLPQPQLPQSVHDITIDDVPSKPVDSQHSWTYPGLGCGVLLRPQFPESVLYAQAQQLAFYRSIHSPAVTRPLIAAAENEATQTIRDNFIQPTLNALGYTLNRFTLSWAPPPAKR
jgi:hypothetical protein